MKKLFIILTILSLALGVQAQQRNHLSFMGIPINGTISAFQAKLLQKGFTPKKNLTGSPDVKWYKGTFSNRKCDLIVYFNVKTKKVYQCRVCFDTSTRSQAEDLMDYFKSLLLKKYADNSIDISEQDFTLMVLGPKEADESRLIFGNIWMKIIDHDTYPESYTLIISYIDDKNNRYNEENNIDDL